MKTRGLAVDVAPPAVHGPVELDTATPVVIKHESRYLLPGDDHYLLRLQHNLTHKADVLGLPAPANLSGRFVIL